ncbi:glycine-rich protein [Patulibacter sp. SYSU D01012]|uniref:glycine-rich protein n=1 Tax=Patulibacter sp. SYSU D01012 TaxID=2817381 RepID=UPI001B3139DB
MSYVPRLLFITALAAAGLAPPALAAERTTVFTPSGAPQTFTVPRGVTSVDATAVGGHGGAAQLETWRAGGRGAVVTGRLTGLRAGQRLTVVVGGNGQDGQFYAGGQGGYNGGGDGISAVSSSRAGGGGGASDVRTCAPGDADCDALASRLIVAAGGGGGGGTGNVGNPPSGAGGDAERPGGDVGGDCRGTVEGGRPGSAAGAGAGGRADQGSAGADGAGARGGDGSSLGSAPFSTSGGGGGGLFGGGGGASTGYCSAGGGGGANLVPAGGTAALDDDAEPQVRLTYPVGEVPAHVGELALSSPTVLGSGRAVVRMTTVVTDATGLGVANAGVAFRADDPDVQIGAVSDEGDGTYSTTVRATGATRAVTLRSVVAGLAGDRAATLQVVAAPSTTVVSPADGTAIVRDAGAPDPTVDVSGRADAGADAVDVGCRATDGTWAPLRTAVPVTDGRFAVQVPLARTLETTYGCRLVALPSDPDARTDDGPYAGPSLHLLDLDVERRDGHVVDFAADADGATGAVRIGPVGACGVRPLVLRDGASRLSPALRCGGITGPVPSTVPVTVDGAAAWSVLALSDTDVPMSAAVRDDVEVDAAARDDGGFTVTERTALVRCDAGTDPGAAAPSAATCASVVPAGVELRVVSTVGADGVTVRRTETYRAVDGRDHRILVGAERFGAVRAGRWRVPGVAAPTAFAAGTVLAPEPGVGALRVDLDGAAPGAVVHAPMPSRVVSTGSGYDASWPARTATPDAPVRFATTWIVGATAPGRDDVVDRAIDAARPTIALDGPAAGEAVATDAVRVRGRATAVQDPTVTVGDRSVPVAADGTFALDVPLAPGENRVVARVTDAFGVTAEAVRTVVRRVPPGDSPAGDGGPPAPGPTGPATPRPGSGVVTPPAGTGRAAARPTVTRAGTVGVRGRRRGRLTVSSGLTAACPADGPSCTATLVARTAGRRGPVVGRSAVALRPGARRVLTLRPIGAAARALARGRGVRVVFTASVRSGANPATSVSRAARIRRTR